MNPEPTLVSCPFCSASGEALKILSHAVICSECDASGPMPRTVLGVRPTRGQVITAWNMRHMGVGDSKAELLEKIRVLMMRVHGLLSDEERRS